MHHFRHLVAKICILIFTDKAALYGIANNHAFVDGNKRTAVHATEMFLLINGISLECDDIEMENIIIGVADNTISYAEPV